ncbi:MAG: hypothetical protein GY847_38610, partial [Proteobacteria bacterium]|nr:hypothetical protein [Pseudomonadota bacterium]
MNHLAKLTSEFDGQSITTITYKGRLCWLAVEIGRALGYSNKGSRLAGKISESWSEELIEDKDYQYLRGAELSEFKRVLDVLPGSGRTYSKAPQMLLLFEPGLHFVLLKTNKPIGAKLRRFLVDQVMPQLVRDGAYLPERKVVDGKLKGMRKTRSNPLSRLREQRLMAKEQRMDRKHSSDAVRKMANTLFKEKMISNAAYAEYVIRSAEISAGQDFSDIKPTLEENWKSPKEISDLKSLPLRA